MNVNTNPRFIADATLAGLAKWLRLLGYDTAVYRGEAGRPMMRMADLEQRILLTHRRDMMERQFSGRLCLVPAGGVGEQLQYVIGKFSLKLFQERMLRICLICNCQLHPVGREDVRDLVPPFVFENCETYNRCDFCGKIYWQGTHVRNAMEFLEKNNIRINRNE